MTSRNYASLPLATVASSPARYPARVIHTSVDWPFFHLPDSIPLFLFLRVSIPDFRVFLFVLVYPFYYVFFGSRLLLVCLLFNFAMQFSVAMSKFDYLSVFLFRSMLDKSYGYSNDLDEHFFNHYLCTILLILFILVVLYFSRFHWII